MRGIALAGLLASGVALALGPHTMRPSLNPETAPATAEPVGTVAEYATAVHTASPAPSATASPTVAATVTPSATATPEPTEAPTATAVPPTAAPTTDPELRAARVPILMYHYISDPPPDADVYRVDLSVRPRDFEDQLAYLKEAGYTSITLEDLYYYMKEGRPLPPKPIILTFDDGYVDNYLYAFPLLRQYGFKGTFFVITSFVDEGRGGYVSWDQLRIMHEQGMDIQSHSRTHIDLRKQSKAELVWQIVGSREAIEAQLGKEVHFFAYPFGRYDWNAIQVLYTGGYWGAVTTEGGADHNSNAPFVRRRVRIHGGDGLDKFIDVLRYYGT